MQCDGLAIIDSSLRGPPDGAARVIAITSGKGGVGKSAIAVNLASAVAQLGNRVLLLDADLGLGNVGILLGLSPRFYLGDVLAGRCGLADAIVQGPGELLVLPAANGDLTGAELESGQICGLFGALASPPMEIDYLVIDTPAGVGRNVTCFAGASQEIVMVVRDEPTSIADAASLMQALAANLGRDRFHLLVNMVRTPDQGRSVLERLYRVCDSQVSLRIDLMGTVPDDPALLAAAVEVQSVMTLFPDSPSAHAFADLARSCEDWPRPICPSGHAEFFLERLVVRNSPKREEAA